MQPNRMVPNVRREKLERGHPKISMHTHTHTHRVYQFSGGMVSSINYPSFQLILLRRIPILKLVVLIKDVSTHIWHRYQYILTLFPILLIFNDRKTRHDQEVVHQTKKHTCHVGKTENFQHRMKRKIKKVHFSFLPALSIGTIK